MKRLFPIALIATILSFASGSALAQDECELSDEIDDNGDCQISEKEFTEYYQESGIFEEWDVNDDDSINKEELGAGLYASYDEDNNGYIAEDEGEFADEDEPEEKGFWDW